MKLQERDVFAGRYRLLRRIGSGGFSVVWLAADQMTEDSEVALKIYVPEKGMDRQGIKMFVREYKIVANLNHPGLLKATHFDVYDGSPFLVMPFCSAGSLHSRIMERGSLPEGEIAEVLEQTAGALAFLHKEEVVHQDIKPDNVLINERGEYLLTDFGISSRMRSTMRKSTGRKESMTLAYAPPERFGGKNEVLPAGDIFSLGVVIYELATGEVPWMAAGGAMLRPDSIPLELPEGYNRELETLMQACVSYSPDDRPTASEVQAAASSYRNTGRWGTVGGGSDGASRIWLWVLVALAVLGGGYGLYSLMDGGGGPVSESQPVVVDSPAVEQKEVEDSPDTDQEEIGTTASDEDEQAAEASAWAAAERQNTKPGYEAYLSAYPDGVHISDARKALKDLERLGEAERIAERRASTNRITKKQINNLEDVYGDEFDYSGEVRNNTPHGYGTARYLNGDKYVGEWKDGKQEGQGTYTFASGNKYEGGFKDGKQEGQGTFTFANGDKYVGEWKDDELEGQGTYTWSSGDKYVGEYRNGDRSGQGTFIIPGAGNMKNCPSCKKYKGSWSRNEKHGFGRCFDKDGNLLYEGKFEYGHPLDLYPNR